MQSLQMALNVSIPLVVYMATGVLMRTWNVMTRDQFRTLNRLIFRLFLPVLLFTNIMEADLRGIFHPKLFLFAGCGTLSTVFLFYALAGALTKEKRDRATIAQGCYRSNYLFFGTLMAQALCGDSGMALLMTLSALIVPMYNIVAVILFELVRGGKISFTHLMKSMLKNPILDAAVVSIVVSLIGVPVPEILMSSLKAIGNSTTPLALITLGGVLSFQSLKEDIRPVLFVTVSRLVVIPLVAVFLAVKVMGFRGDEMVSLLAVYASPTAVASAAMAQGMGGNANLASEIVATTSVACVATIFVFVYTLSSMGII